jgi:hypothetical protein
VKPPGPIGWRYGIAETMPWYKAPFRERFLVAFEALPRCRTASREKSLAAFEAIP